jgi:hypothetical protein
VKSSEASTVNTAEDSTVGFQAGAVHGDVNVYQVGKDASPREVYEVGVNYLDGLVPGKALELIDKAVAHGYWTPELAFHRLLAFLSGRLPRQIGREEQARLTDLLRLCDVDIDDEWTRGIHLIHRLLTSTGDPEVGRRSIEEEFRQLGGVQSEKIRRHLEALLKRSGDEHMWRGIMASAEKERMANARETRAWRFFHPDPAAPRVRRPDRMRLGITEWAPAVAAAAVFGISICYIGALGPQQSIMSTVVSYGILFGGIGISVRSGVRWTVQADRLRIRDWQRTPSPDPSEDDDFAVEVKRMFDRYARKYVTDKDERERWIVEAAGSRDDLLNEIVEVYGKARIDADRVAWLVRHRVSDTLTKWRQDRLFQYRVLLQTSGSTKALFKVGLSVLVAGAVLAVGTVIEGSPFLVALAVIVGGVSGCVAATALLRFAVQAKTIEADRREAKQRLRDTRNAFHRWRDTLMSQRKPDDSEMARWLACDKSVLLDEAMRRFKLSRGDVLTFATLEAPASYCKRGRVAGGPWRYSRYALLLFLLTNEGVRQVNVQLDFHDGTFHDWNFTSYRFDALASVSVTEDDDGERVLVLTLVSGHRIAVQVTLADAPSDDADLVSKVTLDAAGLENTLRVLEGIAADGEAWIARNGPDGDSPVEMSVAAAARPELTASTVA